MCLLTANMIDAEELSDGKISEVATARMASKSGNKDRRREKSKLAARNRRGKETEVFDDLAELLPIPNAVRESLDKASVVRLANCTIKLSELTTQLDGAKNTCIGSELEEAQNLCAALGGFLVVICANGDILLASENITTSLGLAHYEVMGRSIYDFSHSCDHRDVKDLLMVSKDQENVVQRSALIRLKCTLTPKGSCVHIRAATDKVIRFTGKLFNMGKDFGHCFIGIGEPIPTPTDNNTSPFQTQIFRTTHSADFKCIDVDESVGTCLGYKDSDMIGKPLFEFQHGVDAPSVQKYLQTLHSKGQIRTEPYRFLARKGGWAWVITEASVLKPSSSAAKTSNFVCRHIMISEVQNRHEILSIVQSPEAEDVAVNKGEGTETTTSSGNTNLLPLPLILNEVAATTTPVLSTAKIFAPRTDDMDTGFLMPYDCGHALTKDHEDLDLTHLAPIAGDECVQLNSDLFDNFLNFINSSSSECPVLDIDELDFLNSSDNTTTYVPIEEELDMSVFGDGRDSPVLTHNSDPLFGSTININFSAAPAPGPISDSDSTPVGFDLNDQHQLDQSMFDFNFLDMDLPGNLPGELSSSTLPMEPTVPPGHLDSFVDTSGSINSLVRSSDSSILPNQQNANTAVPNNQFQRVSPPKLSFADIENCLLKRKAEGNVPKVVTKSVFSHIRNASPIKKPFPPVKILKRSDTNSQFINGYNTLFGSSVCSGNGET